MQYPNNTSSLRLNPVESSQEESALGRQSSVQPDASATSRASAGALYGFTLAIAVLMLVLPFLSMSNDVPLR